MPIQGIDTFDDKPAPIRFARLGNLRKGAPKQTKQDGTVSRPGQDLKYWRFSSDNPEIEAAFVKAFGPHPVSIPVMLPYIEYEANWQTCKERWVAGGLEHRCDGRITSLIQKNDGNRSYYSSVPEPCPCIDTPNHKDACKATGTLYVIIKELLEAGYFGCVQMQTHSINDIITLGGTLRACYKMGVSEDLRGVSFDLYRVERKISVPGPDGKRIRRAMWLVEIAPAKTWFRTRIALLREKAYNGDAKQLIAGESVALPSGYVDDTDYDDDEVLDDYEAPIDLPEPEPEPTPPPAEKKKTTPPPAQKAHWFSNKDAKDDFLAEVALWAEKGAGKQAIQEALGSAVIADFEGTLEDAKAKLRLWGVNRVLKELEIKPSEAHKMLEVGDFGTIKDGHDLLIMRLNELLHPEGEPDDPMDDEYPEQIPF